MNIKELDSLSRFTNGVGFDEELLIKLVAQFMCSRNISKDEALELIKKDFIRDNEAAH